MLQRRRPRAMGRTAWPCLILLAAAAFLTLVARASAQQELTVQVAGLTAVDPARAQAVVSVLDGEGRPVANLTDAQFQAWLDDAPLPLVEVSQAVDSSLPIAVVLALDTSGSMEEGGALQQAKEAAGRFLDGLAPQDSVAVITFDDTVDVVLPFTQDRRAAATAIDGLTASGATALYEATAESVRLAASAESSRRVVVLLSDGLDHGSALPRADALSTAQTLGVPVFAIGLGADIDRDYLSELARVSGAQFAETPSPDGLAQLYQEVGELLRGQYILTLDLSGIDLAESQAATLRVEATSADLSGSGERAVCLQPICITLGDLVDGERLEEARTVLAQVIAAEPVASVSFFVDGEPVSTVEAPPYQFALDPASWSKGEHALAVEVTTVAGATSAREIVVRTGPASGGAISSLLVIAAALIAAIIAALVLFVYVRRRRRGGEEALPSAPPEPPSEPVVGAPRPQLWTAHEEALPPAPVAEQALGRLRVTSGPLAGQSFPISNAPVSIGFGHRCAIRLPEDTVGVDDLRPEHARVWIRDRQLMVHELRRLTALGPAGGGWEILSPGDQFAIGSFTFRFELEGDQAPDAVESKPTELVPSVLRGGAQQRVDPREVASAPSAGPAVLAPSVLRERPDQPVDPEIAPGAPEEVALEPVPSILRDRVEQRAGPQEMAPGPSAEAAPAEPVPNIWRDRVEPPAALPPFPSAQGPRTEDD